MIQPNTVFIGLEGDERMNQLYESQFITEVTFNNGNTIETLRYISDGYYIKYGEPDAETKKVNNWDDLIKSLGYEEGFYGYKDRKKGLYLKVDYTDKNYYRCQKKVYRDQFISAKSYFKNRIIEQKDIRMKRLVNELNADEFIKYLKDNGIGELPIQ